MTIDWTKVESIMRDDQNKAYGDYSFTLRMRDERKNACYVTLNFVVDMANDPTLCSLAVKYDNITATPRISMDEKIELYRQTIEAYEAYEYRKCTEALESMKKELAPLGITL